MQIKRPLTAGEISLAKTVFGDSIDYKQIVLHNVRRLPPLIQGRNEAAAHGNHISFPHSTYAADFSVEADPLKQSVFIHELTHVWQHQSKFISTPIEALKETLKHSFNYSKCYLYVLYPNKDLIDYGFEQQAAIVQDYFLLSRHGISKSYKSRRIEDVNVHDLRESYERVLAKLLTNPIYAAALQKKQHKLGSIRRMLRGLFK